MPVIRITQFKNKAAITFDSDVAAHIDKKPVSYIVLQLQQTLSSKIHFLPSIPSPTSKRVNPVMDAPALLTRAPLSTSGSFTNACLAVDFSLELTQATTK